MNLLDQLNGELLSLATRFYFGEFKGISSKNPDSIYGVSLEKASCGWVIKGYLYSNPAVTVYMKADGSFSFWKENSFQFKLRDDALASFCDVAFESRRKAFD